MTTKPKARKAPAKIVTPAPPPKKETGNSTRQEVSRARALISRWRWLEADQAFQAVNAATVEDSDALISKHAPEQEEIERMLSVLVPESFSDASFMLKFAIEMAEQGFGIARVAAMLKNVRTGLSIAWRGEMAAERGKATKETISLVRRGVEITFDYHEELAALEHKKRRVA
jgi:hypothetical protein